MEINVKLLEGCNDLEFGMSKEKFLASMGEPNQIETISEPEEPITTLLLQYDEWQTSFFFEGKVDKFYLNSCDTSNAESIIFGRKVFELSSKEIIALFKEMGFDEYVTATEDWGEMRLTFDNAMADFYFSERKLSSIIWGY